MKKFAIGALAALSLALAGCGSLGGVGTGQAGTAVLGNLEHCKRQYMGDIGGLGTSVKVSIECPAKPYDVKPD